MYNKETKIVYQNKTMNVSIHIVLEIYLIVKQFSFIKEEEMG